jgi:hypothetical protein
MATRKQRAANRANAQKSTGPKTPEGKAAVRLNALKHGLTAETAVIPGEEDGDFNQLCATFLDHFQPDGPLETALVHQIVMAQWRIARCRGIETGLFKLRFLDHEEDIKEDYDYLTPTTRLGYVFRKNTDTLATLSRYEARIPPRAPAPPGRPPAIRTSAPRQNQFCRPKPNRPQTRPQPNHPKRLRDPSVSHSLRLPVPPSSVPK